MSCCFFCLKVSVISMFDPDADEHWPRVSRQAARQMLTQRGKIERTIGDDCRHARGAFGAGHRDAIHRRLDTPGNSAIASRPRRSRHSRLPAERVADAVDEIKKAAGVPAHQIAGAVPGIAAREYVAQDFSLRLAALV